MSRLNWILENVITGELSTMHAEEKPFVKDRRVIGISTDTYGKGRIIHGGLSSPSLELTPADDQAKQ